MGLFDFITGGAITYRIRIFDNNMHVLTTEVPDKGQRFVAITVHAKLMGLGEKTRYAFMINPDIKPFVFGGKILELNFDIRDSVPLTDLLDIAPDLVIEINDKYKAHLDYLKKEEQKKAGQIDAEFTVKEENKIDESLLEEIKEEKKPDPTPELGDNRPIDTIIRNVKTGAEIAAIAIPYLPGIRKFKEPDTEEKIKIMLDLCNKTPAHRKLLYWLPKYLEIQPEVHEIVSQSMIYRCGVIPAFYKAQTDAQIAEKVLARPKAPEGWQTVVMIGLILVAFVIIVALLTGNLG